MTETPVTGASSLPTPMPDVNTETAPFWHGAHGGQLVVPKCANCERYVWYPRSFCPHCASTEVTWTQLSGRGHIYSVTVVRRGAHPSYQDAGPYALAFVDLEEGPRVLTNIVTADLDSLRIGQPVRAVFDAVDDEVAIPRFTPSAGTD